MKDVKNKNCLNLSRPITALLCILMLCSSSCKKYLDASPDKQLTTPNTVQDLRSILDYNSVMNGNYSPYGAIASDDYYVTDAFYGSLTDVVAKNNYTWGLIKETADKYLDWQYNYQRLFYVNVVLDNAGNVARAGSTDAEVNGITGEALFYRAFTMFTLSQVYALPYSPATADNTPGLPYRLTADINEPITRPSLRENYQQMTQDLQQAITLLPPTGLSLLRPDKPAACLALANVYLVMQQFDKAESYADSCLRYQNGLINYNTISLSAATPFELFNKEVIWQADLATNTILTTSRSKTDSTFYRGFTDNDLRKYACFKVSGTSPATFKGYYNGQWKSSGVYFAGLAVDEAYLVKAECEARNGKTTDALSTLNTLLVNRYDSSFIPFATLTSQQAIDTIVAQRRKELCFRGSLRWMDIRRLNQFENSKIIPARQINGQLYTLLPGDPHFAFLIPQTTIENSHLKQNER